MAALVIGVSLVVIKYSNTRPVVQGFTAVNGVSNIPCGATLADGEKLYSMFADRNLDNTEDGKKDLGDLKNLLAKLACMKRDLLSPSGLISAEKELQFCTYSDLQSSAETTARCLSKQIPERDLEIQFEKWRLYGNDLLLRLCTDGRLKEYEVVEAEKLFNSLCKDVYGVAKIKCPTGVPVDHAGSPRDPAKYMAPELKNLSEYDGYNSKYF